MKLLYGTANPAKLQHMREMLRGLDVVIIGLNDLNLNIDQIDESGNDPLENAKIKALTYYKAVKMPVFSCDSGLYISGLNKEEQPGVHVRRINGKVLNDEEMIEYYSNIALKQGGEVVAKYRNAISLIIDEENIFDYDGDDISPPNFLLTSKVHSNRNIGFPLDSISVNIENDEYFIDMDSNSYFNKELAKGFQNFFCRTIIK